MKKQDFPSSSISLAFADLFSLCINLLIFRSLCIQWDTKTFADWEWLSVWLGLCLLIPRNGLEIVALRASIRHPLHLREWTAVVLVVRAFLGCFASMIFVVSSLWIKPVESSLILPLALTLIISSLSPDMAARAQFRFAKSSLLIMSRNMLFLLFLKIFGIHSDSPMMAGWAFFSAEFGLSVLWCCDSWFNKAVPGGRWRVLVRRAWKPIFIRSVEQTVTRWIRVFSWSCDALILGMLAPSLWQEVAPSRRFLMTGVIPVAGWIGAFGPMLTRQSESNQRIFFKKSVVIAMTVSISSAVVAFFWGSGLIRLVFGIVNEPALNSENLALNALRFAPMVMVMLSGAFLTAVQADRIVLLPGLIHLVGLFTGCIPIMLVQNPDVAFATMITIEYGSALIGVLLVLRVIGADQKVALGRVHFRKNRLRVDSGSSSSQVVFQNSKAGRVSEVTR